MTLYRSSVLRHPAALLLAACLSAPSMAQVTAGSSDQPRLEEVVVTGTAYRGEVASGGARIDAPVKDLPLSISVATEELIDDRQVRNLRELSDNVAGVRSRASGSGAFTVDFTIRGLQGGNGSVVAVNGFRFENFSAGFDPQAVERVEFLKGPASVLYGASGALGGLVNIVTKTPQSRDFLDVEVTGGSPTYGRATLDGNLALSDSLEARVNAALTTDEVINAFRDIDEQFISPSIRWRPLEGLSILAEGNYFHARQPTRGAQSYPGYERFVDLPKRFKLGEPFDYADIEGYGWRIDASWEIAEDVILRQGVNYQEYREDEQGVRQDFGQVFDGPDLYRRGLRTSLSDIDGTTSQSEIRWTFDLGPTNHRLLAGYEYADRFFGGFCCDGAPIASLDLNNPVYGGPVPVVGLTELFGNTIRSDAWYLQDFIEVGQFKVLAGLRYDDVAATSYFCSTLTPGCSPGGDPGVTNLGSAGESAVSPRLGVAWQPTDLNTLFVSWSKSFSPNTSLDRDGRILPPERGIQYEVGIRRELLDPGKLTLSLSVFDLIRENIADCDPLFTDCSRSIAIGEQRVKGFEAELTGKPAEWLDVVATYAYLNGEVTKSNEVTSGIAVGSELPETVPHSASLFTKIGLQELGLNDVAVSAGIYYASSLPSRTFFSGDSGDPLAVNLLRLPASTRVDVGAFWEVSERLRLQANITNLFDEEILEPVNVGFNRAQSRRATVGARFRF